MGTHPYPFVKNRYYNGKLLSAKDFQNEQRYHDHRMALTNGLLFGCGIVSGLHVQKIDGESLLLEPGCCVDGAGRLVIADQVSIKKARALPGFSELTGTHALLKILHATDPADPVFSALGEGETRTEFNAERETFRLRLDPCGEDDAAWDAAEVFLSRTVLFENETLRVTQVIPRYLNESGATRVELQLESTALGGVSCALRYRLHTPGFVLAETGGALCCDASLDVPESGITLPFYITREKGKFQPETTVFTLAQDAFSLTVEGREFPAAGDFREEFYMTKGEPLPFFRRKLQEQSLDEIWDARGEEAVVIARVRFLRSEGRCLIDEILPPGMDSYANSPALFHRAGRLAAYYGPGAPQSAADPAPAPASVPAPAAPDPAPPASFCTGVAELPAGLDYRPGDVLRTDEIAHGLGPGQAYVSFGLEDVYVDAATKKNRSETILGDNTLFEQVNGDDSAPIDKAVRILPDRGTFFLAVRSRKKLRQPILRLRWYAWLIPEENSDAAPPPQTGALLGLRPETVTVRPGEVVRFEPVFQGDAAPACRFRVEDPGGGYIDASGVYTAPPKEGCFMISAAAASAPEKLSYSFVLVRQGDGQA